jgi:hypothetical protein
VAKRHPNENLRTQFEGTGRFAGTGIIEDRYDDESFPDRNPHDNRSRSFWHKPMKIEAGEVKTYKLTDEELEYYRNLEVERWIKWKNS